MFVESNCLGVLLVHIGGEIQVSTQRVFHQCTAYATSTLRWIDEQRFHMRAVEKHKANWNIAVVDR